MPAVYCPHCGSLLVVSADHLARVLECPDCLARLTADLLPLSTCQVITYLMVLDALQPAELKPILSPGTSRLGYA
jgi:hypothetical protein